MAETRRTHLPSLIQFLVSGLAGIASLGLGALLLFSGVVSLVETSLPREQSLPVISLAWASGVVGILLMISAGWALVRLMNRPAPTRGWSGRYYLATALMLVWPLVVLISSGVENESIGWLVLPPLMVVAAGGPIWWYLESGRRKLDVGSRQRGWGVVAFSALVTVPFILFVELVVIVLVLLGISYWLGSRPELVEPLRALLERFADMPEVGVEVLARWLQPIFATPLFTVSMLVIVAGFTPFIEELFKPLAVWVLAGKKLSPSDGAWIGMLSGATFALLETLGTLGSTGAMSAGTLLAARFGTGLLHIVTAALTGWALASVWHGAPLRRLVGAYLLAVLIHATWNLFGVLVGMSPENLSTPLLAALGSIALPALIALILANLGVLFALNRSLRKEQALETAKAVEYLPESTVGDLN